MKARVEDTPLWAKKLALKMHDEAGVERTPEQLIEYATHIAKSQGMWKVNQRIVDSLRNCVVIDQLFRIAVRDCRHPGEKIWEDTHAYREAEERAE